MLTQQVIMLERIHTPRAPRHTLLVQLELHPTPETHIHLGTTLETITTPETALPRLPPTTLRRTRRAITPGTGITITPPEIHMVHTQQMVTVVLLTIMQRLIQAKTITLDTDFTITRLGNHMQHTQQVAHIP